MTYDLLILLLLLISLMLPIIIQIPTALTKYCNNSLVLSESTFFIFQKPEWPGHPQTSLVHPLLTMADILPLSMIVLITLSSLVFLNYLYLRQEQPLIFMSVRVIDAFRVGRRTTDGAHPHPLIIKLDRGYC